MRVGAACASPGGMQSSSTTGTTARSALQENATPENWKDMKKQPQVEGA
jgi:hypothetical protein